MDKDSMIEDVYEGLSYLAHEEIAAAQRAFEREDLDLSEDQALELSQLLDGVKHDLKEIARIAGGPKC